MNGKSPLEKIQDLHILNATKFNEFPVFILENLAKVGGTYLKEHYHLQKL